MSTGYKIDNQDGIYFLTLQVVDWVDIFSRKTYVNIILESLAYCRNKKGLKLWAYVIMTNHIHLIVSGENKNLSDILRDFKRYTATNILNTIRESKIESRKRWMLNISKFAATKNSKNSKYQFWRNDNHAIKLESYNFTMQKMAYIHENPVRAGYVESPEEWMYSSQRNYSDKFALIEIDKMDV